MQLKNIQKSEKKDKLNLKKFNKLTKLEKEENYLKLKTLGYYA
jgi:hypothetical protein